MDFNKAIKYVKIQTPILNIDSAGKYNKYIIYIYYIYNVIYSAKTYST
jgi:hypothetical protein